MSRVSICLVALSLVPSSTAAQEVVTGTVQGFIQGTPNGQPPRDVRPAAGRSTIRGRVLTVDTGQPMRRATVRITATELRVPRGTLTDADGRYEFRELPAGRYSINASKTAFIDWSYGQTQPSSPGKPLVLADNQVADNIDIGLPRGAVITGRITDELGEPVPNTNVMLVRQQFRQGQRRFVFSGGGTQTNDIGEYRIFGVAPGQYYVSARFQQGPLQNINGVGQSAEGRIGYAPTFYPGTAEATSAQRITVSLAQTISEINIAMLSTRLATVSGTGTDSQGRPITAGGVTLAPRGGVPSFGLGGQFRPDGTFTISSVTPGEYVLRTNAFRPPATPGTPPTPQEVSVAFVTVNGDDVMGVRLTPVVPVIISGRFTFDNANAAQTLKPSAFRPLVQSLDLDANTLVGFVPDGSGPPPAARDDFTFELKTAPGRVAMNVLQIGATAAGQNPWRLKAVRVNGSDVTDTGFDVGGQGVSGVEIELTNRQQQVTGVVTDARGGAVKDYLVVIFAQDPARRIAAVNRYFATARPGDDGSFKAVTLPPGEYYAIALDRADQLELQDPDLLDGLSRQASSFTIAPGDTRTLNLKLFTLQ